MLWSLVLLNCRKFLCASSQKENKKLGQNVCTCVWMCVSLCLCICVFYMGVTRQMNECIVIVMALALSPRHKNPATS